MVLSQALKLKVSAVGTSLLNLLKIQMDISAPRASRDHARR